MKINNCLLERIEFSERLLSSLKKLGYKPQVTSLARVFNLLSGEPPISAHGFRKWMRGESMPVQSRLRVLAEWLQVTPEWLRYGGTQPAMPELNLKGVEVPREIHLILRDYKLLNEDSKQLFDSTLKTILALQGKKHNTSVI